MFGEEQRRELAEGAKAWGIELDAATLDAFALFADRLEEANKQFNLTRIAPEDVVSLHFLDSLALLAVHNPATGTHLLDVGTGAGFPGLPLALVLPEIQVTLLDGTRKRLAFLDSVIAELKLSNVKTLHGRAEEIARDTRHYERYDIATARAVAKTGELAEWLLPLVRRGGVAIAYKSQDIAEEVAQATERIHTQGGEVEQIAEIQLPNSQIVRKLLSIRKKSSLPLPAKARHGRHSRQ